GEEPVEVGCPAEERKADPTGVGDAFRAGFLSGLAWDVSLERAAQVGCMLATLVIETVGTQEYQLRRAHFMDRFAQAYGAEAAAEVKKRLSCPPRSPPSAPGPDHTVRPRRRAYTRRRTTWAEPRSAGSSPTYS